MKYSTFFQAAAKVKDGRCDSIINATFAFKESEKDITFKDAFLEIRDLSNLNDEIEDFLEISLVFKDHEDKDLISFVRSLKERDDAITNVMDEEIILNEEDVKDEEFVEVFAPSLEISILPREFNGKMGLLAQNPIFYAISDYLPSDVPREIRERYGIPVFKAVKMIFLFDNVHILYDKKADIQDIEKREHLKIREEDARMMEENKHEA